MKSISLICVALALGVPALASAQRGGGMGAGAVQRVQRVEVQRIDRAGTLTPARDVDIRRGDAVRGETGTRIRRRDHDPDRRAHHPARRRWNAAHPNHQERRRWNAANPTAPEPSRRRPGR